MTKIGENIVLPEPKPWPRVPDFRLGDVVGFGVQKYVVSGFHKDEDGIIRAFLVVPFVGDPSNIEDINIALSKPA